VSPVIECVSFTAAAAVYTVLALLSLAIDTNTVHARTAHDDRHRQKASLSTCMLAPISTHATLLQQSRHASASLSYSYSHLRHVVGHRLSHHLVTELCPLRWASPSNSLILGALLTNQSQIWWLVFLFYRILRSTRHKVCGEDWPESNRPVYTTLYGSLCAPWLRPWAIRQEACSSSANRAKPQ